MSAFRTVAEFIGWACIALWVLGALHVIDFHICVKDAGECKEGAAHE